MNPRIASSVLVSALIRQAESEGGFGALIVRGDASAGSVLVLILERGANPTLYERILQPNGEYAWLPATAQSADVPEFVARRRRFDPDLWVVELDVPVRERFAAAMNSMN